MQLNARLRYRGHTAGLYTLLGLPHDWRRPGQTTWDAPSPLRTRLAARMVWLLGYTDSLQSSLHMRPVSKYRRAVTELVR